MHVTPLKVLAGDGFGDENSSRDVIGGSYASSCNFMHCITKGDNYA